MHEALFWHDQSSILYAAFNYTAEREDELSICKNQQLQAVELEMEVEAGWFRARCLASGEVGLVPKSFVTAYPLILHREWDLLRASATSPEQSMC